MGDRADGALRYPQIELGQLDAGQLIAYPRSAGALCYYAVPSFLIVGAQKCGTRELHTWLDLHPQLRGAPLECHFFNDVSDLAAEWPRYVISPAFLLTRDQAQRDALRLRTFEKTPAYFDQDNRGEPVPSLIKRMMPSGRFIVILRAPSERAYSAYQMGRQPQRSEGVFEDYQRGSFEALVERRLASLDERPRERLIRIGHYVEHLERWLACFTRGQLLVIFLEHFKRDPAQVMDTVLRFLGLPSFDYGPWMTKNARGLWVLRGRPSKGDAPAYEPMSARARALLERHYAPYDERLRQRFPELELPW